MIDPSKVKVGDTLRFHEVTVMTVGMSVMRVRFPDGRMPWYDVENFAEHIPAPRKIEVGSRARVDLPGSLPGRVVAIHEQYAWLWVSDKDQGPVELTKLVVD